MVSLISLLIFAGFYLWYATTRRIKVAQILGMESWSQQKQGASKWLGSLFLVSGLGLATGYFGVGAGVLVFAVTLMTIASLIILLMPLGILDRKTLILTLLLSLLLENFL